MRKARLVILTIVSAGLITLLLLAFFYDLKPAQSPMLAFPWEYAGSVATTGSDRNTMVVKAYNTEGYLSPPDKYITVVFTNAGLMWVSCKEGYQVTEATSPTSKVIVPGGLPTTVGATIDMYSEALRSDDTYDNNKQFVMNVRCRKI